MEAKAKPALEPLNVSQMILLLVLSIVQFSNVLDFVLMMPLEPKFQREWQLSPTAFGALVGSYAFAAGLAGVLVAGFLDRFDRRPVLLLMYIGFALSNFLCGISTGYWMLLFSRCLAGIFGGVLGSVIFTIIGDVIPFSRRGFAMGLVMSAFSLASIIGIPFGLLLADSYGWRSAFLVLGGLSLLLWPMAYAVIPSVRKHLENGPSGEAVLAKLWSLIREPNHLKAFAFGIVLVITSFMVIPFLTAYMVANVGFPEQSIHWIYIVGGIFTLATMAPFGKLSDRYGKLFMFRILAFIAVIPIVSVTHLPVVPMWFALFVTTALMVFTSARMVPAMALITACTKPHQRAGFMSINSSVQQFAMGAASMITSQILMREPNGPIQNFHYVGYLSILAMLASLYLAGFLRVNSDVPPTTTEDSVSTDMMLAGEA